MPYNCKAFLFFKKEILFLEILGKTKGKIIFATAK